jgi:hypothetical protein
MLRLSNKYSVGGLSLNRSESFPVDAIHVLRKLELARLVQHIVELWVKAALCLCV